LGPTIKALREGKYYCCNNVNEAPELSLIKEEARQYGYKSCLALPIKLNDKTVAVLKLFAIRANFFNEAEINLLERVAENISFALNTFSIEQKRIKAEQELYKVKQAVEQSVSSVVITDVKGNIEYVNPAFTKLTGYSYEEAIGANPNILKTGHTTDLEYQQMWEDLLNKKMWKGEFLNKKKNGELYWENVTISQVVNEAGDITNFIAVKDEITRQKQMEEEQHKLLTILENTTAYIATFDATDQLIWANKAARELLEIEPTEDITKYKTKEFGNDCNERIVAEVQNALMQTGKWVGENAFKSKSGKVTPVMQVVVMHNNESDGAVYFSTTSIDLTRVKRSRKRNGSNE
jgi:PAS domain S-box-containing protein